MDVEAFWALIEKSRDGTEGCDEQANNLIELLAELEPQQIVGFDRHMRQRRAEAYRWDLWAVAYIINGGCSDDGFEYFRCWLIAQGKDYFEAALIDPENAARKLSVGDETECESLLYAASEAYERSTGEELPPFVITMPSEPAGQEWDEDTVEKLYPELAKRFDY